MDNVVKEIGTEGECLESTPKLDSDPLMVRLIVYNPEGCEAKRQINGKTQKKVDTAGKFPKTGLALRQPLQFPVNPIEPDNELQLLSIDVLLMRLS